MHRMKYESNASVRKIERNTGNKRKTPSNGKKEKTREQSSERKDKRRCVCKIYCNKLQLIQLDKTLLVNMCPKYNINNNNIQIKCWLKLLHGAHTNRATAIARCSALHACRSSILGSVGCALTTLLSHFFRWFFFVLAFRLAHMLVCCDYSGFCSTKEKRNTNEKKKSTSEAIK